MGFFSDISKKATTTPTTATGGFFSDVAKPKPAAVKPASKPTAEYDLGLNLTGSQNSTPQTTTKTTLSEPIDTAGGILKLLASLGQGSMRGYAALGGAVTGKPLTPEGKFQEDLYGTDQPISLQSVGEELPLIDEGSAIAPIIGAVSSAADLVPGGKQAKSLLGSLKITKTLPKAATPASSVVQVVNDATGAKTFFRVTEDELPQFKNAIDSGDAGLAGKRLDDGSIYHLTAKTPESMIEAGFTDGGVMTLRSASKASEDTVEQVFRADKLNLTDDEVGEVTRRLSSLGLETRSVRSFDEVEEAAAELGTDVQSLLKDVRQNRVTDQEVVGLRNLINNNVRLVKELETKMAKAPNEAAILQPKLAAAEKQIDDALKKLVKGGTEAGRAVAAYRIIAKDTLDPVFWLTRAQRELGSKEMTDEMRGVILSLVENKDIPGLATFVAGLRNPTWAEQLTTLWKAGLLSSPTTHMANIAGNTAMAALNSATDLVAVPFDVLASFATGERTVTTSAKSVVEKVKGLGEGTKKATNFFKNGEYPQDILTKWELPRQVNFKNKLLQTYTQTIFRTLGAGDIVFRQAAVAESLANSAKLLAMKEGLSGKNLTARVQQLLQQPTNEMVMNSIEAAEYATFQNKNALAGLLSSMKSRAASNYPLSSVLLEVLLPFVKTPANIAQRIAEYSPLGFVKAVAQGLAKHEPNEAQRKIVQSLARATTGTSIMALGAYMGSKDLLTGGAPSDKAERDQFYAEGKMPYAIRLGDYWYQLNKLSPFGNLITLGAEFDRLSRDEEGIGLASATAAAGVKSLTEMTSLQGVSRALAAVSNPEREGQSYTEGVAGSLVPSFVTRANRTIDPVLKDPEGIKEAIMARLPFFSREIADRRDVFGNKAASPGGKAALIDPLSTTKANDDPILQEAKMVGHTVALPGRNFYGVTLDNKEYSTYQKVQGKLLRIALEDMIGSPEYQSANSEDRKNLFEKTTRNFRAEINRIVVPALMIDRYNLPEDTNTEELLDILSNVGEDERFKAKSQAKQEAVIKTLLSS